VPARGRKEYEVLRSVRQIIKVVHMHAAWWLLGVLIGKLEA